MIHELDIVSPVCMCVYIFIEQIFNYANFKTLSLLQLAVNTFSPFSVMLLLIWLSTAGRAIRTRVAPAHSNLSHGKKHYKTHTSLPRGLTSAGPCVTAGDTQHAWTGRSTVSKHLISCSQTRGPRSERKPLSLCNKGSRALTQSPELTTQPRVISQPLQEY